VARFNVSRNDHMRIFSARRAASNALIEGNVIHVGG